MITYKTIYTSSWMGDDCYEIHLKYNDDIIACIYHYTDNLKGVYKPTIHFDKWRKYEEHKDKLPTDFCHIKLAEDAILEYHLLT